MKRSKFTAVLAATICVMLLCSCGAGNTVNKDGKTTDLNEEGAIKEVDMEHYTLHSVGDQWYMRFNENANPSDKSPEGSLSACLSFNSLDELVSRIKTDSFTNGQRKHVQTVFLKDENGVRLFDINNPPIPVFPEEYSIQEVLWYGCYYAIHLINSNNETIYLEWLPEDGFEEIFQYEYVNYLEGDYLDVSGPEIIGGKTVYMLTSKSSVRKMVRYEPVPGVYVQEMYRIKNMTGSVYEESETIPAWIRLYSQSTDIQFTVAISKPGRAISAEELLQFYYTKK